MSAWLKMETGTRCLPLQNSLSMKVLITDKDMAEKACGSKQDTFDQLLLSAEKALPAGFPQIIQNPAMKVIFIMNVKLDLDQSSLLIVMVFFITTVKIAIILPSSSINQSYISYNTQVVEKARHAVLVCEASGSPKPVITWIKDTMPIDLKANPRLSLMKQGKLRGKAAVTKFGRFYVRITRSCFF